MQQQKAPTFTIEATPLEVIALNNIIRYGMLYLEQHPEVVVTRDIKAVKRIQSRLNERVSDMMSAAHAERSMSV